MKKIHALLIGMLLVSGLNAGDVVNKEDMKEPKDITFKLDSLEYLDSGEAEIQYTIEIKDEVKNPLKSSIQLFARQKNGEKYYVKIGNANLYKIAPSKTGGSLSLIKEFSLIKPYSLKKKKKVEIKEADVPSKIKLRMIIYAQNPHSYQTMKKKNPVGYLIVEKDNDGKIKSVKFEKTQNG